MNKITHLNSYFSDPLEFLQSKDFLRIISMLLDEFFKKNKQKEINEKLKYYYWLFEKIWREPYTYNEEYDLNELLNNQSFVVLWYKFTDNPKVCGDLQDKNVYELLAYMKQINLMFDRNKWFRTIRSFVGQYINAIDGILLSE